MKKLFNFALFGAMALTGAVGFSACSSSDDVVNNPDYDPETNSVKTEFAISLPNFAGAKTRQSEAITQAQSTPVFRGMQNLVLIPYNASAIESSTTPWKNKVFNLPAIASSDGWTKETQKAMVYTTLDVPVQTNRFMFYGQAQYSSTDGNFVNGKLNPPSFATDGTAGSFNFTLEPILSSYTFSSAGDVKGWNICEYLKAIRSTEGINSTGLISLLNSFKPTAASSASVQAAVDALLKEVVKTANGFPADDITTIKNRIKGTSTTYATIDDDDNVTLTADNLTGYPANLNLPDGAVAISWSDADPSVPTINETNALNTAGLTTYVYPAALYYRANSAIGVSTADKVSGTYGSATWATISEATSTTYYNWNGAVNANTRSIALHDQIQYAVGRLDLAIKSGAANLVDRDGVEIPINSSTGFLVSAVLVGGQKNVGFDFTPTTSSSYTIYDKVINGQVSAPSGSANGVNHTLVLETSEDADQVNIAVELTNNTGKSFRGMDGTVPAGGKFYLVGTLDLTKTSEITQPAAGARSKIFEQDYVTKVTFTIKAGTSGTSNESGLGAAYNVLPDLTISQLEVAFSVDLTWEPGLEFEIDI